MYVFAYCYLFICYVPNGTLCRARPCTYIPSCHSLNSVSQEKKIQLGTTTRDCKKKSNNWWRRFDTNQSLNSRDPNGKRNTHQRQSCEERGWCWCCYCFWRFHANFHRKIRLMINTFSRGALYYALKIWKKCNFGKWRIG